MTGSFVFPRVQAIPDVDRVSLRIDGVERVAYHFGAGTNAPFLFPIVGPSGALLTRLGSPTPSDRPERSVWFGHENLGETDFWADQPGTDVKIRHRGVTSFQDGPRGGMTVKLDWWAKGQAVLRQTLEVELAPTRDRGFTLDLVSRFESTGSPVEFGQTELGFLGVRVAKTMSESLGGGRITSADGRTGAASISGASARWVNVSGPSAPGVVEGIAILDHPSNPNHPTSWNVQADGLIAPSLSAASLHGVAVDHPLVLRYRLLVHSVATDASAIDQAWEDFVRKPITQPVA